jgi:hypothetical protein
LDGKTRRPLYLVYSPLDANSWTVASVIEQAEVGEFPTLYAALSFIRPVRILHPIALSHAFFQALHECREQSSRCSFGTHRQ